MATQILNGDEQLSNLPKRTQVFLATHDGGTGERLSLRNRSFITFFYGDKPIEDFQLIATINDRIQKSAYASFEDITTSYEVIDGQFYWGTHLTNHELNFTLSTDAITESELDEFKAWFKPGVSRKFALGENWNRYVYARVAAPPNYSLLPFERKITQKIGGVEYTTSTTEYKGDIELTLIVDDPLWRSDLAVFTETSNTPNAENVTTLEDKDCLKILVEDKIPYITMLANNTLVANKFIKTADGMAEQNLILTNNTTTGAAQLYYCGTAPAKPVLKFTITPIFDSTTGVLTFPNNSYTNNSYKFNFINLGSSEDSTLHSFRFTTPSLFTGYNQALDIVNSFEVGESFEDLKIALRDNINEYYSRAWAMGCAMHLEATNVNANGALTAGFYESFKTDMQFFFSNDASPAEIASSTFSFNSKTGEAIGYFGCRIINENANVKTDGLTTDTTTFAPSVAENVGDMVKSDYLLIEGKSRFDSNGNIIGLVPIKLDFNATQFSLDYQYMYF